MIIINAETNEGIYVTCFGWEIIQGMGYGKKDLDLDGDLVLQDPADYKRIKRRLKREQKGGE